MDRARSTPIAAGLALLAACAPRASGAWLEVFPSFPGARRLCSQHVTGTPTHIEWTAYATERPPAEVMEFYEKNHGAASVERSGADFQLRAPGDRVLSVHAKGGAYPRCGEEPATGEATVIIVSQAIR